MSDIVDEIERLAKAVAEPRKWYTVEELRERRAMPEADGELIAALKPGIVLDLVARLRARETEAKPGASGGLAKVREALEPFANIANGYDNTLDADDRPVGPFQLAFCRAARSALATLSALMAGGEDKELVERLRRGARAMERAVGLGNVLIQPSVDDFRLAADRIALLEAQVAEQRKALSEARGYMLNAKIDLETGTKRETTLNTLAGGLRLLDAALTDDGATP